MLTREGAESATEEVHGGVGHGDLTAWAVEIVLVAQREPGAGVVTDTVVILSAEHGQRKVADAVVRHLLPVTVVVVDVVDGQFLHEVLGGRTLHVNGEQHGVIRHEPDADGTVVAGADENTVGAWRYDRQGDGRGGLGCAGGGGD